MGVNAAPAHGPKDRVAEIQPEVGQVARDDQGGEPIQLSPMAATASFCWPTDASCPSKSRDALRAASDRADDSSVNQVARARRAHVVSSVMMMFAQGKVSRKSTFGGFVSRMYLMVEKVPTNGLQYEE
jgi:hypothetical protein